METPIDEAREESQAVDERMKEAQAASKEGGEDEDEEPLEWPESPTREVLVS